MTQRKKQARLVVEVGHDMLRTVRLLAAARSITVRQLVISLIQGAASPAGEAIGQLTKQTAGPEAMSDADLSRVLREDLDGPNVP